MNRLPTLRAGVLLVLLLLVGCGEERYGMPVIRLRFDTASERRATLRVLRHHWETRPNVVSPDGNLYERALLNRAALFGRRIRGTETYYAACDFWMNCVRDHISRYEDDAHRFRQ